MRPNHNSLFIVATADGSYSICGEIVFATRRIPQSRNLAMSTLQRLGLSLAAFAIFALITTFLCSVVVYKPYGVHDLERERYEERVAEIKLKNKILQSPDLVTWPVIEVPKREHDFGLVEPHTTLSHAFTVKNVGKDPLAIEVLRTTCKCTSGDLRDGLLQPGESTEVTLTWNTGKKTDDYQQRATLQTNDPNNRKVELIVQGTVRTDLSVPEHVTLRAADPGETASTTFVVYSQLYKDFDVDVKNSSLEFFEWSVEPLDIASAELAGREARSAWKVHIQSTAFKYGKFEGSMDVTITPNEGGEDDRITKTVSIYGKVRVPISFVSPDIDRYTGLDMGTLTSGKRYDFHVSVRVRGKNPPKLAVLDVQPKELEATLSPQSEEGLYRLTLTIPEDCPNVMFNRGDEHGYVHVGDLENPNFMNWFPIMGAVAVIE